jgi:hypothetical protein
VIGGATAGSSRNFRLDPCTLPVRSVTAGHGKDRASFFLDRDKAVMQRGSGDNPARVAIPIEEYDGVAVRIATVEPTVRLTLELLHADPELVLPLAIGGETEGMANDWEAWGRELELPLLVVLPDGTVSRYDRASQGVQFGPVKPRRRHSHFVARRPRFLTRRKTGRPGPVERLAFREIIARS